MLGKKKEDRFEVVWTEGSEFSISKQILVDKETGVNYLFVKSGFGAGITPLLDAQGNVVVTHRGDYRYE